MRFRFGQVLARTNSTFGAVRLVRNLSETHDERISSRVLCLPVVDSVEVAAEIYVAAAMGADEFMGG